MSSNGDKSFQVSYLTATSPPHSPARTGEADLGVGVEGLNPSDQVMSTNGVILAGNFGILV